MMKCSKCGFENADEAVFCTGCGAPMEEAPAEQQPEQATAAPVAETSAYATAAPAADTSAYTTVAASSPAEKNTATLWLILNIVATVLCCPTALFSIIGIILAAIGMGSYKKGDYEDMKKKAKIAMIMFIVTIVLGLIGWIIVLATGALSFMSDMSNFY